MAGILSILRWTSINTFHHASAPEKTIVQVIAPSNHRLKIKEISVGFRGIDATAVPIVIDWLEQSTAGTTGGDGGALTPVKDDASADETLQVTATKGPSTDAAWTTEPTAGNVRRTWVRHPQSNLLYLSQIDVPLWVPGGGRGGLRVRNYHGSTGVNCDGYIIVEE